MILSRRSVAKKNKKGYIDKIMSYKKERGKCKINIKIKICEKKGEIVWKIYYWKKGEREYNGLLLTN